MLPISVNVTTHWKKGGDVEEEGEQREERAEFTSVLSLALKIDRR